MTYRESDLELATLKWLEKVGVKSWDYGRAGTPEEIKIVEGNIKWKDIGTIIHYGSGFTKAIEKQKAKSIPVDTIEFPEENKNQK